MENILSEFKQLLNDINKYNPVDLISKLSALRLLPNNGDHSIRLDALLHLAASTSNTSGLKVKRNQLNRIVNSKIVKTSHCVRMEDPKTQLLCEIVSFFGGSYRVFTGAYTSITFNFEHILKSLFLNKENFINSTLSNELKGCALFILKLNEEIAERANVLRYTDTIYRSDTYIPDDPELTRLSESVKFSEEEIQQILYTCRLNIHEIKWLVTELNEKIFESYDIDHGELITSPILKINNQYIVTDPSSLLFSYEKRIIEKLKDENVLERFAIFYRAAIWSSIEKYLDWFGFKEIKSFSPIFLSKYPIVYSIFAFDLDKVLVPILITENFENLDKNFIEFDLEFFSKELGRIVNLIFSGEDCPNEILFLFITSAYDRPILYKSIEPPLSMPMLLISADSLQIITILEGGNPLFLYKYAYAENIFHKNTRVIGFDPLSEYGWFKKNGYTFYVDDKPIPNAIYLTDDFARSVRYEALQRMDIHSVNHPLRNVTTEVMSLHDKEFPLYIQTSISQTIEVLLEGLELLIWFINDEDELNPNIRTLTIEIIDMIGYWFYEMKDYLNKILEPIHHHIDSLIFFITLENKIQWLEQKANLLNKKNDECVNVEFQRPNRINIRIFPSFSNYIYGKTNEGERATIFEIFQVFKNIYEYLGIDNDNLTESIINKNFDQFIPIGIKKKISVLNPEVIPEIDPQDLPRERLTDDININLILDEIGKFITANNLVLEDDHERQADFVNKYVVGFLWKKLKMIINTLNGHDLIWYLIMQCEALTREKKLTEIQYPMRLALFDYERITNEFNSQYKKLIVSNVACRFLIECAIGLSPKGIRLITDSLYDDLLAISVLIINWGFTSDLLYNNIGNIKLKILPSGRIGQNSNEYDKAFARFNVQIKKREATSLVTKFERYWEIRKKEKIPEDPIFNELNKCFIGEYNFSIDDYINFILTLRDILVERNTTITRITMNELKEKIIEEKDITINAFNSLIKELTLETREHYFSYPSYNSVNRHDFYPWRYNRLFSYVRRPILLLNDGEEQLLFFGIRHLKISFDNLFGLIFNGRLISQVKTKELTILLNRIREPYGKKFNIKVSKIFLNKTRFTCKTNVRKINKKKITDENGNELGDIDIFVIDKKKYQFCVIECKDFLIARTPYELNLELQKFIYSKDSKLKKHIARGKWVKKHTSFIIKHFKLDFNKKWKVKSFFIIDEPLFSAHLINLPDIKILIYEELAKKYNPKNAI